MSFGGHQSQTTERIKALYDMRKYILIILSSEEGLETLQKIFRIFVDSFLVFFTVRVFMVIKYSTATCQLTTDQ